MRDSESWAVSITRISGPAPFFNLSLFQLHRGQCEMSLADLFLAIDARMTFAEAVL